MIATTFPSSTCPITHRHRHHQRQQKHFEMGKKNYVKSKVKSKEITTATATATSTQGSEPSANLPYTTEITVNDVLFGRGAPTFRHPGNVRFREMVKCRKAEYIAASQHEPKKAIAKCIIDQVVEQNGRFLREIKTSDERRAYSIPSGTRAWAIVDDIDVDNKVKQALREGEESKPLTPIPAPAAAAAVVSSAAAAMLPTRSFDLTRSPDRRQSVSSSLQTASEASLTASRELSQAPVFPPFSSQLQPHMDQSSSSSNVALRAAANNINQGDLYQYLAAAISPLASVSASISNSTTSDQLILNLLRLRQAQQQESEQNLFSALQSMNEPSETRNLNMQSNQGGSNPGIGIESIILQALLANHSSNNTQIALGTDGGSMLLSSTLSRTSPAAFQNLQLGRLEASATLLLQQQQQQLQQSQPPRVEYLMNQLEIQNSLQSVTRFNNMHILHRGQGPHDSSGSGAPSSFDYMRSMTSGNPPASASSNADGGTGNVVIGGGAGRSSSSPASFVSNIDYSSILSEAAMDMLRTSHLVGLLETKATESNDPSNNRIKNTEQEQKQGNDRDVDSGMDRKRKSCEDDEEDRNITSKKH